MLTKIKKILAKNKIKKIQTHEKFYQPLYACPLQIEEGLKHCTDRAQAILQRLRQFGKGMNLVDLGANLGYFCYFFAHHGYHVTGIEQNKNHIAVAKALKAFNQTVKQKIAFFNGSLEKTWIEQLNYRQYDVALIFKQQQPHDIPQLLKDLMEKIPVLFIESDTKDCFDLCEDIHLELLGHFPSPLYCVFKTQLQLNQKKLPISNLSFNSYANATYRQRAYYTSNSLFIKEYLHCRKRNLNDMQQEKATYELLKNHTCEYLPRLQELITTPHATYFIMDYLGDSLFDLISKQVLPVETKVSIIDQVIQSLAYLKKHGLYHNDLRVWNVLYHQGKISLIDFSYTKKTENQKSTHSLLWFIYQLETNDPFGTLRQILPIPNFDNITLHPQIHTWVQQLLQAENFEFFLEKYEKTIHC